METTFIDLSGEKHLLPLEPDDTKHDVVRKISEMTGYDPMRFDVKLRVDKEGPIGEEVVNDEIEVVMKKEWAAVVELQELGWCAKDVIRAVEEGNIAAVRLCYAARLPLGRELIVNAVKNENLEMLCALYGTNASQEPDPDTLFTPLHHAAFKGNLEVLKKVILETENVNPCTAERATPLHLACFSPGVEIAEALLEAGADVTSSDIAGHTPLHYAARESTADVIELLLDNGCSVNVKNIRGETPLHIAVLRSSPDIATRIAFRGQHVDLETRDSQGYTALHTAAAHGKVSVVRMLLQLGARGEATTPSGFTPADLASMGRHIETVRCLRIWNQSASQTCLCTLS
eukprot:TRINITY_DN11480_c0_g1_i1.p1 TRINITY_DN11480_c0_g1~~TRINITY_DN11480_c0_g1_i1.p1  ORF type:complete len:345 (+),score=41.02 TRINITY_DN11480_c0_g1_i1:32-1066(+)